MATNDIKNHASSREGMMTTPVQFSEVLGNLPPPLSSISGGSYSLGAGRERASPATPPAAPSSDGKTAAPSSEGPIAEVHSANKACCSSGGEKVEQCKRPLAVAGRSSIPEGHDSPVGGVAENRFYGVRLPVVKRRRMPP